MFATVTLLTLVNSVSGTPYISGGDSPRGTDCSGLVSWVTNAATGRPIYGDRFNTGNIERALLARGFQYGSQPGALNVGWNGGHTAATLPDGTPVSSGEGGGVQDRWRWCLPEAVHPPHVPADGTRRGAARAGRDAGPGRDDAVHAAPTRDGAAAGSGCTGGADGTGGPDGTSAGARTGDGATAPAGRSVRAAAADPFAPPASVDIAAPA